MHGTRAPRDRGLPGVVSVEVFLASEKAAVRLDPAQVSQEAIRDAVEGAGYRVAHRTRLPSRPRAAP